MAAHSGDVEAQPCAEETRNGAMETHFEAVEGLLTSAEYLNHLIEDLDQNFKKGWIRIRLKSRIWIRIRLKTGSASKKKSDPDPRQRENTYHQFRTGNNNHI